MYIDKCESYAHDLCGEKFGMAIMGLSRMKAIDLSDMTTQLINIYRSVEMSKITSNMLSRINELKSAADEMRLSSADMVTGASTNLSFTGGSEVLSAKHSYASKSEAAKSSSVNLEIDALKARKREIELEISDSQTTEDRKCALVSEIADIKSEIFHAEISSQSMTEMASSLSSIASCTAGIGSSVGAFSEALHSGSAKRHDAEKMEIEADAQIFDASYEANKSALESLKSLASALIEFRKEVNDYKDSAISAIARNV